MGRMLGRVLGLLVVLAVAFAAPPVAAADPGGSMSGWRSPASGPPMDILVQATPDRGTGAALDTATVRIARLEITESFADGTCSQTCPAIVVLSVDTLATAADGTRLVPDGDHLLVVTIEDVNGATKEIQQLITVDNSKPVDNDTCKEDPLRTCVDIHIGSGSISPPASPPGGGVKPDAGPTCRSPRLTMCLASKPLRFRRGVPVLARGRVYRYAGELTCRINGRRRAAPRGMKVQVRNRLRGWTISKPALRVRKDGDIVARLRYRSSRVVIFRVVGAGGDVVRVRIPIRVVKVKRGRR